jgi:hypothetical protein
MSNESKIMNKKLIRLTESDLHRIVKESVNNILNEWFFLDTDPSKAKDEKDYDRITKNAKAFQKGAAENDQDNSNARDTRKAASAWVGKDGTKKKGQFPSPKEMKNRHKRGDF